jgi:hypothetical protein
MASTAVAHGQVSGQKTTTSMQDALPGFLKDLQKAEAKHKERCARYDTFDDIYNGRLAGRFKYRGDGTTQEGDWHSDLHPPFVFETIQTELAMLLDDKPIASVTPPKGKVDKASKDKASAYEQELNEQRRKDNYAAKMVNCTLHGLIYGLGIVKSGWAYDHATLRTQSLTPVYGQLPERVIEAVPRTVLNQPTITVCNPRDVMWNPEAESAEDIVTLFHRTYETKASLRALAADGVYENVKDIAAAGGAPTGGERPGARDVKDCVEVLERWQLREDGVYLTTVANRSIVIRDEDSPYLLDGKQHPFSFVTPTPWPFRVEGKSECELIGEQQVARWRVANQMLEAGDMILSPPVFYKDNIEDPDSIIWATGKANFLPASGGPLSEQIWMPAMPTALLTAGKELLDQLKDDMEAVTGVSSYLSGAPTESVDPKTATEVQSISQGGQRRVLMKKQRYADQEREIGTFQLQLNEQLLPDAIEAYGPQGEPMPLRISDIIGCCYEVEDADESLNRQERRTEAALVMNTVGALMAIPQFAVNVNARWLLENFFEANDIDPEQALAAPPQGPPMPLGGTGLAPGGGGAPPGVPPTPGAPVPAGPPGSLPALGQAA